jgi:hypothetical protein
MPRFDAWGPTGKCGDKVPVPSSAQNVTTRCAHLPTSCKEGSHHGGTEITERRWRQDFGQQISQLQSLCVQAAVFSLCSPCLRGEAFLCGVRRI